MSSHHDCEAFCGGTPDDVPDSNELEKPDWEEDEYDTRFDVPYSAKKCYCAICGQNEVDALNGYDTCEKCLSKQ